MEAVSNLFHLIGTNLTSSLFSLAGALIKQYSEYSPIEDHLKSFIQSINPIIYDTVCFINPSDTETCKPFVNIMEAFSKFITPIPNSSTIVLDFLFPIFDQVFLSLNHYSSPETYSNVKVIKGSIFDILSIISSQPFNTLYIQSSVFTRVQSSYLNDFIESPIDLKNPQFLTLLKYLISLPNSPFIFPISEFFYNISEIIYNNIKDDYTSFIELRIPYFDLLTKFLVFSDSLFSTQPKLFHHIVDKIIWGSLHPQQNLSSQCTLAISRLIRSNLSYIKDKILDFIRLCFSLLSDPNHKSCLFRISNLIDKLFSLPEINNKIQDVYQIILEYFPNVSPNIIVDLIESIINDKQELFMASRKYISIFLEATNNIIPFDRNFSEDNAYNRIKDLMMHKGYEIKPELVEQEMEITSQISKLMFTNKQKF